MGWDSHSNTFTISTQQTDSFPLISSDQFAQLQRVINALPPGADSWETLKDTYSRLGLDDDILYSLFLKLSLKVGVDWKDKWEGAKVSLEERGAKFGLSSDAGGGGAGSREAMGEIKRDKGKIGSARLPKDRRSEGLSVLKARLDEVKPVRRRAEERRTGDERPARPQTSWIPDRASSTPGRMTGRQPSPPRSTTREFLVDTHHGASSSDDYVGVPHIRPEGHHHRNHRVSSPSRAHPKDSSQRNSTPLAPRLSHDLTPRISRRSAVLPQSSIVNSRRPISTVSPSAPVNSYVIPTALEETADHFRRVSLLSRAFGRWRDLQAYIIDREARVEQLVKIHRMRWMIDLLKDRTMKGLEMVAMAEREDGVRVARLRARMFAYWKKRALENVRSRRHKEREERLLAASMVVRNARSSLLLAKVFKHWYRSTLESRATRFHRETLIGQAFSEWRLKCSQLMKLNSHALEFAQASDDIHLSFLFGQWKYRTILLLNEKDMANTHSRGLLRSWLVMWKQQSKLGQEQRLLQQHADTYKDRRLLKYSFASWRRRLARIRAMSDECDAVIDVKNTAIVSRCLNQWTIEYSGGLFSRALTTRRARRTLQNWKARYEWVTVDLEDRALVMLEAIETKALHSCLDQWQDVIRKHDQHLAAASLFADRATMIRALRGWCEALVKKDTLVRKAEMACEYFLRQRAWRKWGDRMSRRRARALQLRVRAREKREIFTTWLALTRKSKADQVVVELFQQGVDERIRREYLQKWEQRVIDLRNREIQTQEHYERMVLRSVFNAWTGAILRHGEAYSLLESALFVRDQKLLRSSLKIWVRTSRRQLELERRLVLFTESNRLAKLELLFDRWRENSLRFTEQQAVVVREGALLRSTLKTWQRKTKLLPAVSFDKITTLRRAMGVWLSMSTDPSLREEADRTYRIRALERCLTIWRIKWDAKVALSRVRLSASRSFHATRPAVINRPSLSLNTTPSPISRSAPLAFSPSALRPSGLSASASPSHATSSGDQEDASARGGALYRSRNSGDHSTYSSRSTGSQHDSEGSAEYGLRARLRAAAARQQQERSNRS
ncbi:hypothetical protein T439DRAFT_378836 [Meredithblackwellia eburnea MCA 4105]